MPSLRTFRTEPVVDVVSMRDRGPNRRGVAVAVAIAAGLIVLGLLHPVFRHDEGHLSARFCVPLALAASALIIGMAAGTRWAAAARWFALAVTGQAFALQLIDAGNMVGHQHYTPFDSLSPGDAPALGFVLLQLTLVSVSARQPLRGWMHAAVALLGRWRLAGVAALMVLTSATLSQHIPDYLVELVFASLVQALGLVTIMLAVHALPRDAVENLRRGYEDVLGRYGAAAEPGGIDRFAVTAAIWAAGTGALLAWLSYQRHPHVPDEVVYLYHARYFAQGMLTMPLPPVPAAFNLDLMTYEAARWYSPVPPGWPAALAVGVAAGAAWLVNPLLNGLNVLLSYILFRELYDRRTARLALLLLCASPWFVFMGMNFMTHTFTLACGLGAAVSVARLRRGRSMAWVMPGGAAIGMMGMIRPLEGLTLAALLGLWGLGPLPWGARRLVRVTALAAVSIGAGALMLPYNAHLAGDPLTFPLMAYTDSVYGVGSNALGFGADRGLGWPGLDPFPGHGILDVLVNGNLNAHSVNVELFGWSAGSLLALALLLFSRRLSQADRWMVIVAASVVLVHSLYWFSGGPDFGARYWYLILIPCVALSARAIQVLADMIADCAHIPQGNVRTRVSSVVLALAVSAVVCVFPWRAIDKYYHYRNMRPDVRQLADAGDWGRSLILVRGNRHPDYASAAIYNPLDLQADAPVYVWDRDPQITRDALIAYRDRPVWIIDGPTRTGAGFRVVAGPVTAGQVLAELPVVQ